MQSIAFIRPRLAKPFHRPGWVFEAKEDGWRIVAIKEGQHVRLPSRTGRDHAARFPDVAAAIARLSPRALILDGEVCVFDANLVSQFHLLSDPGDELATPPVDMALDCLRLRGAISARRRCPIDVELSSAHRMMRNGPAG
jgi:ATP-dependent DNA ligase